MGSAVMALARMTRAGLEDWWHRRTCGHRWVWQRNFHGDVILYFDARSAWECKHCGKWAYFEQLGGLGDEQ